MTKPQIHTSNVLACMLSGVGSAAAAFLGFCIGNIMLAV